MKDRYTLENDIHDLPGQFSWLLDNEQRQFLDLNPWNMFFLERAVRLKQENHGKEIRNPWQALGLDDPAQAGILDLICNSRAETDPEPVQYQGSPVNTPLLSAVLDLAFGLDLSAPGTLEQLVSNPAFNNQLDLETFSNSFTVTSAGPHEFLPGTIRVCITCTRHEVHRVLKHFENHVRQQLHRANTRVSPRFIYSDVVFEIRARGYQPLDMKFSVDSTAALTLLTGNRLYSDRRVFLRELVQNAVDACTLRRIFEPAHIPEISISFDSRNQTIRFRDNGIGMDRQWIEKYFLKIGISFYRSGDLKTASQGDVNFISKFGIGFLASFMVSDRIRIRTRKKGLPGLEITISGLEDYFEVRPIEADQPVGTEVTIYLKDSGMQYARSMEFTCYLKTNLRFLSIPVTLEDHEGRTSRLGDEPLAYATENNSSHYSLAAPLGLEDSKGFLFLKAKRNLDTLYGLESARGGISIFQDGIFVTQTDLLLPEGARQSIIGRINLTGRDRCELSMDRNRIFWTDARLKALKQQVRLGVAGLVNRLVTDAGAMEPALAVHQGLVNNLAVFFDFNELDDAVFQALPRPVQKILAKRFRDFVRVHFAHTRQYNQVPDADGYAETWQQEILAAFLDKARPKA